MEIKLAVDEGMLHLDYWELNPDWPTLLFLHDALGAVGTWKTFPRELATFAECNYLVYDRLGHGMSSEKTSPRGNDYLELEADILLEIIQRLEIAHPFLFGHSDGGSIALIAAAKAPQVSKGLIAEAAHIFVEELTLRGIRVAKAFYGTGKIKEKLTKYHGPKTDTLFSNWTDTWLSEPFRSWNIEHFLPSIECPCLILQGEKDEYGTVQQLEGIRKGLKAEKEIVLLPHLAHVPHKEDPEQVLHISSTFLKKISRP